MLCFERFFRRRFLLLFLYFLWRHRSSDRVGMIVVVLGADERRWRVISPGFLIFWH